MTIYFNDWSFRMVDGEKPVMGYIYESMDLAKEAIKAKYQNDERWDRQLHSPLHVVGYVLNPAHFYDKTKFTNFNVTCIKMRDKDSLSFIF